MHYAAKSGSDANTQLILDNLSQDNEEVFYNQINAKGHRLKTPLHKARGPKVVKLLIDAGGDEYWKMMDKVDGEECSGAQCNCNTKSAYEMGVHSVFSTLLHRNDKAAEVILNNHITTNKQELDSSDLLIIYDLNIFNPEAKPDADHADPHADHDDEDMIRLNDEMSTHSKICSLKSSLLMHPLSQVYLELKWKCLSKYFWVTVIQYMLYVLSLSGSTIYQTWLLGRNETTRNKCLHNSFDEECYFTKILRTSEPNYEIGFYAIYGLLAFNTTWLFFREFFQMCFNWPHWSRSAEDKMEAILILTTIFYLVGVFMFPIAVLKHFAAWSVFFAWIEMILLVGRFPHIGKYVQMFFNVSKVLVKYLMVYSPAVIAFSLAFYILLSDSDPFLNPINALMKTSIMLLGELEFEGNFLWVTAEKTTPYFPSTQLLIVLFVLLGCIVIMNLLVGLAVDEINVMKEKGRKIRLEIVVDEIVRLEDLLVKKPTLIDCLPCCQAIIIRSHSLFKRLFRKWDESTNPRVKKHAHPTKLCVRPIMPRKKQGEAFSLNEKNYSYNRNTSKPPSSYPVYFYHEDKGRPFCAKGDLNLGFKLSKTLVMQTLEWLKQREETDSYDFKNPTTIYKNELLPDVDKLLKIRNEINGILSSLDTECVSGKDANPNTDT